MGLGELSFVMVRLFIMLGSQSKSLSEAMNDVVVVQDG